MSQFRVYNKRTCCIGEVNQGASKRPRWLVAVPVGWLFGDGKVSWGLRGQRVHLGMESLQFCSICISRDRRINATEQKDAIDANFCSIDKLTLKGAIEGQLGGLRCQSVHLAVEYLQLEAGDSMRHSEIICCVMDTLAPEGAIEGQQTPKCASGRGASTVL